MKNIADFSDHSVISIVGAGGKTSLMFYLARTLPWNCLTTTTTKVGISQLKVADRVGSFAEFMGDPDSFNENKVNWVSPMIDINVQKVNGFTPLEFRWFSAVARSLPMPIIIEADGAHCRHIKASSEFEPVIPEETTHVLHLTGLDVLDRQIDEATVHRPEIFMEITETQPGDSLDEAILIRNILHPRGGFKNAPRSAKKIAVFNQADTVELVQRGFGLAEMLLNESDAIDGVWITSLHPTPENQIPGIIHQFYK